MKRLMAMSGSFIVLLSAFILSALVFAQAPDGQQGMTIDAKTKTEAINELKKELRELYVYPDMGNKLADMLEERQSKGEYDSVTDTREFCHLLTKQMRDIAHDGHLVVLHNAEVFPPSPPKSAERPPDARELLHLAKLNYGFEDVQRLPGNIGYLKLNSFANSELGGGPTLAGAMAFLANTDALIIDLRQNGGGSPNMVALLASYFFGGLHPVKLNDFAFRIRGTTDYEISQLWTVPYVPGQKYVDKEVYILTSHTTFSAGEEFTYDLQSRKRAIIVGQATGGGANTGSVHRLADHISVVVPQGHAINPITHTNWEGVGVKPEIETPVQDALKVAQKTALEHLIAKTTDEQEAGALKRALKDVETKMSGGPDKR